MTMTKTTNTTQHAHATAVTAAPAAQDGGER